MKLRYYPRTGAAVMTVTAALVLSACSAGGVQHLSASLPAKNVDEWVMPLDQFVPVNGDLADYAENLLVQPCMEKAGFSWSVPWRDVSSSARSETQNAVGRRLFNTSIAAHWGYHDAARSGADAAAWAAFAQSKVSIPNDEEQTLTTCVYAARKGLPRLDGQAQIASSYGQVAFVKAKSDGAVTQAASKWRDCMSSAGISDLPSTPLEMPTASMMNDLTIDNSTPPSANELVIASKDASCRTSSKFDELLYIAEWNEQLALLDKNADTLERVKATIAKNRSQVLDVITKHAPSS